MFDIKYLEELSSNKTYGIIQSPNKLDKETNLLILQKEIEKTKKIRESIINIFEQDITKSIKDINYEYLENVPYPLVVNIRDLFNSNNQLKIKIFTKDHIYANCLFTNNGLESSDLKYFEVERISSVIIDYIKKIIEINNQTNILDNSFYDKLNVLLYNNYIKKLIISGDGIKLPINEISNLNSYEKNELLKFYYGNLKRILKHIKVLEVNELLKYKSSVSKEKILELYRG